MGGFYVIYCFPSIWRICDGGRGTAAFDWAVVVVLGVSYTLYS